jgi:hypothetical protein
MNSPDYLAAAGALFNAFTFNRLIPLVMLFTLSVLFIWVLFQAQKRKDFDASMFLRNDRGILDFGRLAAFICCMSHTWYFFTRTLNGDVTKDDVWIYCVTWSGSLVLLQALETWRGIKTNTPLPNNPMLPETQPASPPPPPNQEPPP